LSYLRWGRNLLQENWGAPFFASFIVLLVVSGAELSYGLADVANATAQYSFFTLVLGAGLQIACYLKHSNGEESRISDAAVPRLPAPWVHWDRREKVLAITIAAVVLISTGAGAYLESGNIQPVTFQTIHHNLSGSVSFTNALKEPDGTVIVTVGVEETGGELPYKYVVVWADGLVQNNTLGVFSRSFLNHPIPSSANITIISFDGQTVTVTAQIPAPT
jgi:hypothetical protein